VIWNVSNGLQFLHKQDRIHRDIKSDNILLTTDGQVKIGDFGFVAQLEGKDKKRRTRLGTPYWMAPEVIKGKKYDYTADVWSLGILIYECVEGDPPYYNQTKLKALLSITKYGCPALSNLDAWSPELNDFVKICLKKKPEKRANLELLMKHPWLQPAASDPNTNRLIPLIKTVKEKARAAKENQIKPPQIMNLVYGSTGMPDQSDDDVPSERDNEPSEVNTQESVTSRSSVSS